jgi:hypothetical protein
VLKSEEESDEREGHTPRCFGKSAEEYERKGVAAILEGEVCAKSAQECENGALRGALLCARKCGREDTAYYSKMLIAEQTLRD